MRVNLPHARLRNSQFLKWFTEKECSRTLRRRRRMPVLGEPRAQTRETKRHRIGGGLSSDANFRLYKLHFLHNIHKVRVVSGAGEHIQDLIHRFFRLHAVQRFSQHAGRLQFFG